MNNTVEAKLKDMALFEIQTRLKQKVEIKEIRTHVNPQFHWKVISKLFPTSSGVICRYYLVTPQGEEIMMSREKALSSFDNCVREFIAKTKLSNDLSVSAINLQKKNEEVEKISETASELSKQNQDLYHSLELVKSSLELEKKAKQELLEIMSQQRSSLEESTNYIKNLNVTMQELKSFMTLDTKQIQGSEGLSNVTSKRISKMETDLAKQTEENAKLKATLAHSVKMVAMQDKMICDLEKQSLAANPALKAG